MMDSAMEAATRAVMDTVPVERGTSPREASAIFAEAAVQAYLAAKEAEGWVMAPVEATARMVVAGANERDNGDMELHARKWRAMIAARPPHLPPSPE